MYYHGTNVGGLTELKPSKSNEGCYVYLQKNRVGVFPYLVNPIQRFVDEKYGKGKVKAEMRWAIYYYDEDKLVFTEPWPNYLIDTFKGAKGYIYTFKNLNNVETINKSSGLAVYGVSEPITVEDCEVIEDVYEELLKLQNEGKVVLRDFSKNSKTANENFNAKFLKAFETTTNEIYREFLEEKCPYVKEYIKEQNKK